MSRAICNFCGDDYSMGSDKPKLQTSTNLKNHLKSMHENEYLKRMLENYKEKMHENTKKHNETLNF